MENICSGAERKKRFSGLISLGNLQSPQTYDFKLNKSGGFY